MEPQKSCSTEQPNDFSRLIGLNGWSYEKAQEKTIAVVGCGGIGNPVARYLSRMGIGNFILVDSDRVEDVNLNRDGFLASQIGKYKVDALRDEILSTYTSKHKINIEVVAENILQLDFDRLQTILKKADMIISATDSTNPRLLVNDLCVELEKRYINVGFTTDGLRGHVWLIIPYETACYRCTYFELPSLEKTDLRDKVDLGAKTGYYLSPAPVLTFLASLTAMMTVDILFGISRPKNYISVNLVNMSFYTTELLKRDDCPVCGDVNEK